MQTDLADLEILANPLCAECRENRAVRVVDEFRHFVHLGPERERIARLLVAEKERRIVARATNGRSFYERRGIRNAS
jgi:hypothetical protein